MPHTTPLVETGRAEEDVMRPVVSSIVALAIAFAPIVAYAAPEKGAVHKPVAAKVMKHHKKTGADQVPGQGMDNQNGNGGN